MSNGLCELKALCGIINISTRSRDSLLKPNYWQGEKEQTTEDCVSNRNFSSGRN